MSVLRTSYSTYSTVGDSSVLLGLLCWCSISSTTLQSLKQDPKYTLPKAFQANILLFGTMKDNSFDEAGDSRFVRFLDHLHKNWRSHALPTNEKQWEFRQHFPNIAGRTGLGLKANKICCHSLWSLQWIFDCFFGHRHPSQNRWQDFVFSRITAYDDIPIERVFYYHALK